MKNIYLCGFMGCGKSHIGRLLAKMLGCTFADLDKYIEEKEGRSIPDIFANEGEAYFRTLESRCIKEMPENSVVATGGGAIINPDTAKTAREKGIVVFLDFQQVFCFVIIVIWNQILIIIKATFRWFRPRTVDWPWFCCGFPLHFFF